MPPKKANTAMSNSQFCALGGQTQVDDPVTLAQICRLVERHALVPKCMRDADQGGLIYKNLPEHLRVQNEKYYEATAVRWPISWRTASKVQQTVPAEQKELVQDLFDERDKAMAMAKEGDPTAQCELVDDNTEITTTFLSVHLEQILKAVDDMRLLLVRNDKDPDRVLEAEFRTPVDDLHKLCLQDYEEPDTKLIAKYPGIKAVKVKAAHIKVTTLAERKLNLSRNPIMFPIDPMHEKRVFEVVRGLVKMGAHPTQEVNGSLIKKLRSYLDEIKFDEKEKKKVNKTVANWEECNNEVETLRSRIYAAWSSKYDTSTGKPDTDNSAYHLEPRTGTCDRISAISVTIDQVIRKPKQHSRYYDFIRLGHAQSSPQDTQASDRSKHLGREASPKNPSDIMGGSISTTPAENTARFSESPANSTIAGTEVLLPVVIGEMKRKMPSFDATGGNQLRQYLVSGVQFLATLGARSVLQFGYLTEGNNCTIVAAFAEAQPVTVKTGTRETKLEKIHILERQSRCFDLASPLGALGFVSFLLWCKYMHAQRIQDLFQEDKPCYTNLVNFKTQTPLPVNKQPDFGEVAWTAILQRPVDDWKCPPQHDRIEILYLYNTCYPEGVI